MLASLIKKSLIGSAAAAAVVLGSPAQAVTKFETDVGTAIDRGLTYFANIGAFNNPSAIGDGAGLAMLALLEKRINNDPTELAQGYADATPADQARLRTAAANILDRVNETSFYSYRDGNFLMALSVYALTGGPDKGEVAEIPNNPDYMTIVEAMNALTDRIIANMRKAPAVPLEINQGYTCYTNNGCEDSSTTQFAVAGMAAAKSFYSSAEFADAGRVTAINAELARSRKAYELNGLTGSDNTAGSCGTAGTGVLTASERGHGYRRASYRPSLQQTASGIYIQLFGGADVNSDSVQAYMEWILNRYRYTDLDNLGNSWPGQSHGYYLWSSFKAMELIRASGVAPAGGNIGPDDWGKLAPGSAPACNVREVHKDPAVVSRPASFGAGGAGYYDEDGTDKSHYFDYAHTILTHQCYDGSAPISGNDGYFICNGAPGSWEGYDQQAYKLLVLQRAVGGACVDSDGDGVCDEEDNCPAKANANQADRDRDGVGDVCDNCPDVPNPNQEDSNGNGIGDACEGGKCDLDKDGDIDKADIRVITGLRGQTSPPADSNADADGNGKINVNDARACTLQCTRPRCRLP
jgi:hypothetical protein